MLHFGSQRYFMKFQLKDIFNELGRVSVAWEQDVVGTTDFVYA